MELQLPEKSSLLYQFGPRVFVFWLLIFHTGHYKIRQFDLWHTIIANDHFESLSFQNYFISVYIRLKKSYFLFFFPFPKQQIWSHLSHLQLGQDHKWASWLHKELDAITTGLPSTGQSKTGWNQECNNNRAHPRRHITTAAAPGCTILLLQSAEILNCW